MIRYIPFIAAAGGGGGPAGLIWYEAEDLSPGGVVTSLPEAQSDLFDAALTASGVEDFESFFDGQPMSPETSTINGVTVSYSDGVVSGGPFAGRFNTTSGGTNYLEIGSSLTLVEMTFSSAIAALGMYMTDVGDFSGQVSLVLHKSGGGTITHDINHTINGTSGSLLFIGFTDDIDTYTQVDVIASSTAEGCGIDDLRVATQAQLA